MQCRTRYTVNRVLARSTDYALYAGACCHTSCSTHIRVLRTRVVRVDSYCANCILHTRRSCTVRRYESSRCSVPVYTVVVCNQEYQYHSTPFLRDAIIVAIGTSYQRKSVVTSQRVYSTGVSIMVSLNTNPETSIVLDKKMLC